MSDGDDQSLLDRVTSGLHRWQGLEQTSPAQLEELQPAGHAAWVRQKYAENPQMARDYLQAAATHPQLFQHDTASIMAHVEPVVSHFARDGLTRPDYFRAVAAEPQLLLQKPATVIRNLETVMDHYAADQVMRTDYLQAAVDQPVLFRTPSEAVIANIKEAVDHLEAEGVTRSDFLRQAVHPPRLFTQGPQVMQARTTPETCPSVPCVSTPGQVAASSPLPSTSVDNPVLYVSYVAPAQGIAR